MVNIVLIIADQFRYDCVGTAGIHDIRTPNLNRLAAEGVFFTNAYTPAPVCAPARQCLASGRMADSFGAFWNYNMKGLPCVSMTADGETWSDRLHRAGYNTAYLGKWHTSATHGPGDFGYAHFTSTDEWRQLYRNGEHAAQENHLRWFGEKSFMDVNDSQTHYMADKAAEYIKDFAAGGKPFFVSLNYTDPHLPCRPSEPFASMYERSALKPWASFGDTFEKKPYIQKQMVLNWGNDGKSWEEWTQCVANYYGMISQIDDSVGRVLEAIDESGCFEDTVVIFTSDHGDTCGGHGMLDKHCMLYDDVCRVPFIVRFPALAKANLRCEAFVSNMLDIAPTIEEICGIKPCGERHGMSLVPLIRGREQPERDAFAVSSSNGQQFGFFCNRSLRDSRWRYVWNLTDVDELYDHESDPGELNNLAANPDYAEVLRDLRLKLYGKLVYYGDPFAGGWVGEQLTCGRKY